jgi:hypothetical protein
MEGARRGDRSGELTSSLLEEGVVADPRRRRLDAGGAGVWESEVIR